MVIMVATSLQLESSKDPITEEGVIAMLCSQQQYWTHKDKLWSKSGYCSAAGAKLVHHPLRQHQIK
jgi:hypothetical protein